jgi:hypothetical protein
VLNISAVALSLLQNLCLHTSSTTLASCSFLHLPILPSILITSLFTVIHLSCLMTPGLIRVVLARAIVLFPPAGRAVLFRIYSAPSGGPMATGWWWWMSRESSSSPLPLARRLPRAKVIVAPNRLAPGELNAAPVSDLPWIHQAGRQAGRRPCVSSRRVSHCVVVVLGATARQAAAAPRPVRSGLRLQ